MVGAEKGKGRKRKPLAPGATMGATRSNTSAGGQVSSNASRDICFNNLLCHEISSCVGRSLQNPQPQLFIPG